MLFSIFFLENASQIGFRIPGVTAPRTYQRQRSQNPASDNERPSNPGVQGQSPGPLSPHFSGEMGSPAGQAGQRGAAPQRWLPRRPPKGYAAPCRPWQVVPLGPPQVSTCKVVSRPAPGGGSRLSLEKARTQRVAGEGPRPPFLMARLLPLARFGVGCRIVPVDGLLRYPSTYPDLGTFFRKNAFQHIFSGKCVPNRF